VHSSETSCTLFPYTTLFRSYQYVAAIKEYESLVDKKKADGYVFRQLADSYYNIYNMDKAAEFYAKGIGKDKDQDAEVYYRYAQALKSQGKYEEANKQMDKFAAKSPNDQRAKAHKANPNYVPTLQSKTKLFDVEQTKLGKDRKSTRLNSSHVKISYAVF